MSNLNNSINQALKALHAGGVIAYPTEGVFGLGCDPFNESAVHKLLAIKQRPIEKGLILIAANWEQIQDLIGSIPEMQRTTIESSWPGPETWVFPASQSAPSWICGSHSSIALRITAHPIAQSLCQAFGKPIVSTSANLSSQPPTRDTKTTKQQFSTLIDYTLPGNIGKLSGPTPIRDALTGKHIR